MVLAALSAAVLGCASGRANRGSNAGATDAQGPGDGFTILSINDTYRIEGLDGGTRGGLARVRSLRASLEAEGQQVLMLHAGDLFYPAFQSRKFGGAQVVDALNLLDGDGHAFDQQMFATFGNHEFDKAKLSDAPAFETRIRQSQFRWLATNLSFAEGVVEADNLVSRELLELGGVQVGIFSLTIDEKQADYVTSIEDPVETARAATSALRAEGAEVVIGLTHLRLDEDEALLEALGAAGPDLIFGGHEHERHVVEVGGRWVFKADADAASAVVAKVGRLADGTVSLASHSVVDLDSEVRPDREIAGRVRDWLRAFDLSYCVVDLGKVVDCLQEKLGRAAVELVAEELEIRKFETNLGNWVTDLARAAYADRGAQIALVNSGSLRLNQNLAANSDVERKHIEELFAYPAELRLLEVDGKTLQQMLDHSVETWTGNGFWLQVSGIAFRHDPENETASDPTLLAADGTGVPIGPEDRLRLVVPDFLVDPAGGQDGYTMLTPDHLIDDGPGPDLKDLVVEALAKAGDRGVAPVVEGRICNPQHPDPPPRCLAVE